MQKKKVHGRKIVTIVCVCVFCIKLMQSAINNYYYYSFDGEIQHKNNHKPPAEWDCLGGVPIVTYYIVYA